MVYFIVVLGSNQPNGDAEGRIFCEANYLVISCLVVVCHGLVLGLACPALKVFGGCVPWASPRPRVTGHEGVWWYCAMG